VDAVADRVRREAPDLCTTAAAKRAIGDRAAALPHWDTLGKPRAIG
jgi:hypothetical protein